jgi:DNA anti-recombination protein RmuC
MLESLRRNLQEGLRRLRFWAEVLNARMRVELSLLRTLGRQDALRRRQEELFRQAGQRLFERRHALGHLKDEELRRLLKEMQALEKELQGLRQELSALGEAPEE